MGTSTRRTYENAKKKIDKLLNDSSSSITIDKLNKIISEVMYPKNGKSKIKQDISNSISNDDFCRSISKIIKTSKTINSQGIAGLGISGYENKNFREKVQLLTDYICDSEDPILKQTIVDVLSQENDSPELNLIDAIKCIFSIVAVYLRDKIESFMFEEAASNDPNFNDEELQQEIDNELNKQIGIVVDLDNQQQIIDNYENIEWLKNKFGFITKTVLKNVWG